MPTTNRLHFTATMAQRDRSPPDPLAVHTESPPARHPRQGVYRSPVLPPDTEDAAPRRHSVDFVRFQRNIAARRDVLSTPQPFSNDSDDPYNSPDLDAALPPQPPSERSRLNSSRTPRYGTAPVHSSSSGSTPTSSAHVPADPYDDAAFDDDDPENTKSVLMLSCSILMITSVVFVIIVSGLTKIVRSRASKRFHVQSDWPDGGIIPDEYGCLAKDGVGKSFPISWHNVPSTATNLVVLFANPSTLAETNNDPVHWFVTDIPLEDAEGNKLTRLEANASADPTLMPNVAIQRPNVHFDTGLYYPPCPARSSKSLFVLHVYAIDKSAVIETHKDARQIMNRFAGVPSAKLSGKYGFSNRVIEIGPNKKGPHHVDSPLGDTAAADSLSTQNSDSHAKDSVHHLR